MTALLIVIEVSAALMLIVQSIAVLNRMTRASCQTVALAWVALAVASLSECLELLHTHTPDWHTAAILASVAWMGAVERRRRP